VFNTATVRENLRVAIGETVGDDVSKFVAALAKKLAEANKEPEAGKSAKKITQGEFERAKDERKALVKQAEAMMANYGEEIATVREALELADAQVVALLEKVE
jgi:ribosome-binding protein aMBF1 (putative translation factor)